MRRRATHLLLAALLGATALAGCAPVQPWEREILSRADMAWQPDPLAATLDSHIHFSKEASLPGGSAGGGGCGCN